MPVNLYVLSTQDFTGKSAICVSLLRQFQQDGYRIGYIKPFSSAARVLGESRIDEDARFVKETFELPDPIEDLDPVVFTGQRLKAHLTTGGKDYSEDVLAAVQKVGKDRDIVVMEGSANFREGYVVGLSPNTVVELVNARVVAVVGFRASSMQVVDDALTAKTRLGDRLVGVIINMVPDDRITYARELIQPYLEQQGIKTLAIIPNQSILRSVSVGEINTVLDGDVLCYGCYNDLVENLVVASMGMDYSIDKFRKIRNKAVIVGGDRPDIQMDALETDTNVLILTGKIDPAPQVRDRAELENVAIVLSSYDTLVTIEKLEQLFNQSRFTQVEKVDHFKELLGRTMDFETFYRDIGLT
jgi:BioD-like phosphotransacetylase family protein